MAELSAISVPQGFFSIVNLFYLKFEYFEASRAYVITVGVNSSSDLDFSYTI